MATQAHCAYCFETLHAHFEHHEPLSLESVQDLWERYHASKSNGFDNDEEEPFPDVEAEDDGEMTDADLEQPAAGRPAAISRLLNRNAAPSAASSSSSLPSTRSTTSSTPSRSSGSGADTPASSRSSLFSFRKRRDQPEERPLFVTWNTVSRSGYKSLRGCIGTFEPQALEYGLRSYSLTRYHSSLTSL